MGKLTTHVLDTMSGRPGHGMQLALYRVDGADRVKLAEAAAFAAALRAPSPA